MAIRSQPNIGVRLRELRLERGLSLTAVAAATGLSASSLSMTETGKSDITFGRLQRLIDYYGVTFAELIPERPPTEPVVVRAGARRALASPIEGIQVHLLTHAERHRLQPVLVRYEPGGELIDYQLEPGLEVFWLMLDGELELALEGVALITVGPGDSVLFDQPGRLGVRNTGSVPATFVAVGVAENRGATG
jgi:transcriptional regulator with XRE-family HTH domain